MIKPINQSTCEKLQLTSNQLISCTSHAGTGGGRGGRRFPRSVHSCPTLPSAGCQRAPGELSRSLDTRCLDTRCPRISPGGWDVPWVPRHRAPATEYGSDNTHGEPKDTFALIEHPLTATCTIFVGRKFEIPTKSEQLLCPIYSSKFVGFSCGFTSVCFPIHLAGIGCTYMKLQ